MIIIIGIVMIIGSIIAMFANMWFSNWDDWIGALFREGVAKLAFLFGLVLLIAGVIEQLFERIT